MTRAVIGARRVKGLRVLTARLTLRNAGASRARVTVRWTGPKGTRRRPAVRVARRAVVRVSLRGRLAAGVWTCTLRADGRVAARARVRVRR